jgi:hypothetical protein
MAWPLQRQPSFPESPHDLQNTPPMIAYNMKHLLFFTTGANVDVLLPCITTTQVSLNNLGFPGAVPLGGAASLGGGASSELAPELASGTGAWASREM